MPQLVFSKIDLEERIMLLSKARSLASAWMIEKENYSMELQRAS
jgi:hypothetical protein